MHLTCAIESEARSHCSLFSLSFSLSLSLPLLLTLIISMIDEDERVLPSLLCLVSLVLFFSRLFLLSRSLSVSLAFLLPVLPALSA